MLYEVITAMLTGRRLELAIKAEAQVGERMPGVAVEIGTKPAVRDQLKSGLLANFAAGGLDQIV